MNRFLVIALVLSWALPQTCVADELRVLTFNLWHGGDAGKQPLSQSVEVIKTSGADIVGLQETLGYAAKPTTTAGPKKQSHVERPDRGQEIADALGWSYVPQGSGTGILSRFPIGATSKLKWGAEIEFAPNKRLWFFNVHLAHAPYQPYQLLKIPYGDAPFIKTADETIQWAHKSRGEQVTRLLQDVADVLKESTPALLTGDFNEPSFQDWTRRAVGAKLCPIAVEYPTTKRIVDVGFVDAWRAAHPDEVAAKGWTWTTTTSPDNPQDKHDRIDFVFATKAFRVTSCQIVGERGSDVVVEPWPSDHRAVVATVEIDVQ